MRHVSIGFRHERTVLRDQLRRQQRGVPRERADDELAALDPDVGKAGHAVDVDENGGLHEPQVHHRHQALPAGKILPAGAWRASASSASGANPAGRTRTVLVSRASPLGLESMLGGVCRVVSRDVVYEWWCS